ncbi:MAG: hypothetical protein D6758_07730 [Gammaproteobacteria bacterium]|nr:MAG: hypothetical protein D6758_07730 [Gammaproteobacteria bacterium]
MWQALEKLAEELESLDEDMSGEALLSLDERVLATVEAAVPVFSSDPDRARALLGRIQQVYQQLMAGMEKTQARYSEDLVRAQRARQAISAYLNTRKPSA